MGNPLGLDLKEIEEKKESAPVHFSPYEEDILKKFKDFYELYGYSNQIIGNQQYKRVNIDFSDLIKFDNELGETFIGEPDFLFGMAERALMEFNNMCEGWTVRVKNLTPSCFVPIREIRKVHLTTLISITGTVIRKTEVRPKIVYVRYECGRCGEYTLKEQKGDTIKPPFKCPHCKRSKSFFQIEQILIDNFKLVIQESVDTAGMQTQLQQVKVQLSKDLCDSNIANRIYYGAKVDVVGVLKEQKAENKNGTSTQLDIFLEASYIKIYDDFFNLQITKEEEEKIIKIGKSENPLKIISENIFYGIHGYEKEGEAITLAGAEGITDMPKGKRGKIHIMLMGDSGTAKSAMLKSAFRCFPKARYCSGKTVTGVGLVGAVVRDGKMGDASFEAGALALSDNGSIMLDELDKINEEDRDALHEPLDMMTITIDKYNFHLQLLARTNVLAGANPKGSKFDPNQTIYSQIDLPDTIINRFDLIFIHRREKNVEREEHIARKILTRNEFVPELDRDFIKKYFIYIKRFNPKLTPFLQKEYIPKKYAGIRGATEEQEYPTTPRHVEIIERLSEAKARIHLRDEVSKEDVDFAIDLLYHSLKQFGIDPVTGKVDEMLIETGVSSTQAGRINTIRQIINEITNREGKLIPIENIIAEAKPKNINEDSVEEVIEKLKKAGDIFEPRRGYISKI